MTDLQQLVAELEKLDKEIDNGLDYHDERYWEVRKQINESKATSVKALRLKAFALKLYIERDKENGVVFGYNEEIAMRRMISGYLDGYIGFGES